MSYAAPSKRLYIGRLSPSVQTADVEGLFSSMGGKITDIKLLNGYGFLEFESVADAEDAIRDFDARDFMGDRIIVQFAKQAERRAPYGGDRGDSYRGDDRRDDRGPPRGGGGRQQGWRLNISNLPPGCSWQDLKDFGRTAGNIHYAEVSRQDPSEGVIEYMSHNDADSAIRTLDGVDMRGSVVRLTEGVCPPGQSWSGPRASPPRRDSGRDDYRSSRDDDRYSSRRRSRSRSRSPGYGGSSRRRDDDRYGGSSSRRDDGYSRRDDPPRRDRDDGYARRDRYDDGYSRRDRSPRY